MVFRSMLCFGYGRWQAIRVDASVTERSIEEVADVGRAIMAVMLQTEAMSMAQVRRGVFIVIVRRGEAWRGGVSRSTKLML